jgi:hypothetical protein
MMNLELHIEKLVLPDLSAGERRRVVSALEQELLRLLREEGVPPQLTLGQSTLPLDASQVAIAKDTKPDAIGRQLAQTIHTDLMRKQP